MARSIVSDLFAAKKMSNLLKTEVTEIDHMIQEQAMRFDPELVPYMEYICSTPGKRLRPVLALLTGGACGGITEQHKKLGVVLELIHMSSLVHDDIIDEADVRRGVMTPNAKWGNGMAVLLGDVLFAHSMMLSTDFDSLGICQELGRAARDVCEGEVKQSQRRFDCTLTYAEYFRIIEQKTAALFAAAGSVAAQLSGKDEKISRAMHRYGILVGNAYQIYDDCLDIVGNEADAGKTLRTDSEKGKLTLPMLFILESRCHNFQRVIDDAIKNKRPFEFPEKDMMMAIARAVTLGQSITVEARAQLDVLEPSVYKDALVEVTYYLDKLLNKCI